jgi:hypothetical protein
MAPEAVFTTFHFLLNFCIFLKVILLNYTGQKSLSVTNTLAYGGPFITYEEN